MMFRALSEAFVANGLRSCLALLLAAWVLGGPLVTRWMADPMAVAVECESASAMDDEVVDAAETMTRIAGATGLLASSRLPQGTAPAKAPLASRHDRVPVPPPRG